jgi:hypothetical protein
LIEADLESGALVQIKLEDAPADGYVITMLAIHRTDSPPGPAGRWFIERLKQEAVRLTMEKPVPIAHMSIARQASTV